MSWLEAVLRFLIGGTLILLVSVIGREGKSAVAGLVAMFPVVTALSYYFLGRTASKIVVKETVLSSLGGLPIVAIFLVVTYFCLQKFSVNISILIGIGVWIICGAFYLFIKSTF